MGQDEAGQQKLSPLHHHFGARKIHAGHDGSSSAKNFCHSDAK